MSEEDDVFDEDLVRELGLEPEDLEGPSVMKKRKAASPPADRTAAAPQKNIKVPPPSPHEAAPSVTHKAPVPAPTSRASDADLEPGDAAQIAIEIPVQMVAVMAKKSAPLKDILALKTGEIIEFKKMPHDPIDLVANGKLIAKAELVLVEGKVGARILKLVK